MRVLFRRAVAVAVAATVASGALAGGPLAGSALAGGALASSANAANTATGTSGGHTARLVRLPSSPTAAGYGLDMYITFATSAPTTEFQLAFDLPPTTIPNPWSGYAFTRSGNRWTLNYRSGLPQRAGETLFLWVTMLGTTDPANCLIQGNPCVYEVQTDPVPPSSPAPVTATRYSGTSPWGPYAHIHVTWGRSTDNFQLSGYEVSANGQVLTTTGISTFLLHVAYTTQQVTYTVRAFDSVGNFSSPATFVLPAL